MNESLYKNPFSEETIKLRRNLLAVSTVNIFIWVTYEIPNSFSLFGLTFSSFQNPHLGWFIFTISLYFLLHYLSISFPEIAIWLKPILESKYRQKERMKHPAFGVTDFLDLPGPYDGENIDSVIEDAKYEARQKTIKRLSLFYSFIYLKIVLDVLLPIVYSIFGITVLLVLIIK
ncbi:hypothetical protein [Leptospira ilyithenensis]|uniref:Uncharacterized protein n=1 Tax=Leptospira ilyithenensis TaxID=2484901 RepID=A0A4R9LM85_9LEPT|nr:hypothetical protein [Leptospira ilyithenensis]TGN09652.1 hypothetical protein EHS11_11195 [Leptospira ilyithenensis]